MKKININESQYNRTLVNEGLSSLLYHFTSLSAGFSICSDDKIYLQSAFAKDADNYDKKRKYYLSCTRVRSSQFGYSKKFGRGGVRIALDGDLLSTRFKGKQINYWNGLNDKFKYYEYFPERAKDLEGTLSWEINRFKKNNPNATPEEIQKFIDYNFNKEAQTHTDNESEDRLFSYEPVINDAHKYIKSVDVLIPNLDEEGKKLAAAFLFNTVIGRLVKIYDSEKEFNSLNGKNCNEKIEYIFSHSSPIEKRREIGIATSCLEAVIIFISFGNPEFEGKKFGEATMKYLKKYGLDEFNGKIGQIINTKNRMWGGFNGAVEKLDSVRRSLSDTPSRYTAKILKMLTDYCIGIGAKSFREAYKIKEKMTNDYFSKLYGGYASSRIDTMKKETFLVNKGNNTIVLYPEKEKFSYVMGWNDEWIQANSDSMSYDAFDYNLNHSKSHNVNSLRTYLFKLFKKGTVANVLNALKQIGFDEEYLRSYNIDFTYEDLDYYDATRYNTADSRNTNDYKKEWKIRDGQIEKYFADKQRNQN